MRYVFGSVWGAAIIRAGHVSQRLSCRSLSKFLASMKYLDFLHQPESDSQSLHNQVSLDSRPVGRFNPTKMAITSPMTWTEFIWKTFQLIFVPLTPSTEWNRLVPFICADLEGGKGGGRIQMECVSWITFDVALRQPRINLCSVPEMRKVNNSNGLEGRATGFSLFCYQSYGAVVGTRGMASF